MNVSMNNDEIIDQLNSFLRGEISAVESYRMAIDRVKSASAREDIARCLDSHEERVDRIRSRVASLGGKPAEGSGVWGAFTKLLQGGADLFGDRAAVSALEEGEDHGRDDYRRALEKFDAKAQDRVVIAGEPQRMGDIGRDVTTVGGVHTVAGVSGADIGIEEYDSSYSGFDTGAVPSTVPSDAASFNADEFRSFTERLLSEQLETHRAMSGLKKSLAEDTGEIRPVI